MTLRTLALATTTLLVVAATGCSSSSPPPAQGSMYIHVKAASSTPAGMKCTVQAHNAQIGATAPSGTNPGSRVADGDGARVSCTVKSGSTFSFTGYIRKGPYSFQIKGSVGKDTDGTGQITSFDPTSATTLQSPKDTPCVVTPVEVAGGRIWATYQCPGFVDPTAVGTYCAADGAFVFENCEQ